MKSIRATLVLLLSLTLSLTVARAVENTWDFSVQVSSSVQSSPAKITLSWPQDTNGTPSAYTVYRKSPRDTSWGAGTTLAGSATSYVDTSVSSGAAYEYRIVKSAGGYTGYGYIQTGIEAPLVDARGKVVLVVDSSVASPLASELTRLENDLAGDGWLVVRRNVARTDSASAVKSVIKAVYDADPSNVKSVFLFGHVPVPYSGQLNPDGHPDHTGAWPADAFYGDMDGSWTDSSVNYTQSINTDPADAARLSNRPGDGKFDQTQLPSAIELEVGRVDLANLPGRTTWGGPATLPNEIELLRAYLNKDNAFRHRRTNPQRKAIVGDYFGSRGGEAFAASGFRSFAPLVGANNIRNLNIEFNDQRGVWIPQVASQEYLLAYGCGAGSYATVAGLGSTGQYNDGSTPELVSKNSGGVFNLLFGSWLGDWDHEDNILRAPLATSRGLVSVWSGRPHWFIHSVGLGETIGYSAKLTQNNNGLYQTQINSSQNRIHVALMGDPTLRLHPVVPVSSLNGSVSGSSAALSWGASADTAIVGYHVYRRASATSAFTRLTSSPITATNYVDNASTSGATYMVRAVKLETTPSGSYYNAAQGLFWTVGGSSTTPTTPPADTSAPSVSLTSPAANATVSGSVTVTASATDNVAVTGVQFKLDGANLGSEITSTPFSATLNTTTLTNGSHTLSAVARDAAGNLASVTTLTVNVSNTTTTTPTTPPTTTTPPSTTTPTTPTGVAIWFDDALPANAGASASGGDGWNWVTASPAPFSGTKAHQSNIVAGLHEHAFNWGSPMTVNAGDLLVTYVYLDPSNLPSQIMLSFAADNWEHRAYWGANQISNGTNGTASRFRVGDLPAAGQWVRLEVPASAVGLEGKSVQGMSFSLYNGRATFDLTGKATASTTTPTTTTPTTTTPTTDTSTTQTVTVAATDANALIGSATDTATLTFTRTGSTAASLVVNYTISGSAVKWIDYRRVQGDMPVNVTIPAGAASTTMTILAISNVTNASPATAIFTLANDAGYVVGSANKATLTLGLTAVTTPVVTVPPTEPVVTAPTTTTPTTTTTTTTTPSTAADTVWFDDALPAGANGGGTNGDGWNWVSSSPAPFSGTKAHQTNLAAGLHEHYFNWASNPLTPATGDKLFVYVYLDAANAPAQIMLSFAADNWEHRAYWGANCITSGTNGTASRYRAGDLPAAGQWVRLEVSAAALGLEGQAIKGMSFSLHGGRATFDKLGKTSASSTSSTTTTTTTTPSTTTSTTGTDFVWVDDAVPAGAGTGVGGGDAWNWVTTGAFSGTKAHQSNNVAGLHEHYFNWASNKMAVSTGDVLYTYVYLDPASPPSTIMLSFGADNWEHRVYWGANTITYGANGTAGRYYAGPLPAAGQWVRLEVPASALALEGQSVQAMCFSTFNGRVTYDKTGKVSR